MIISQLEIIIVQLLYITFLPTERVLCLLSEFSLIPSAIIAQKLRAEAVQIPAQSFAIKNTIMKCSAILSLHIIDIFQQ